MVTEERLKKIRACICLIPDPGYEVARELIDEIERLREALQTIRLATCDYATGTRASLEAAHKLATDALKTPNALAQGRGD